MEKENIYKYIGSMQQLAYIRSVTCEEGRSRGMKMYDVKNGCLQYLLMADKCLDMAELSYKGININFLSKPGLQGRNQYDTHGNEALRSIMGGMFFTAGFENICAPYCDKRKNEYPMHGRIRTTPAENLSAKTEWQEQKYVMTVEGEMREAELFGENIVLRRKIRTTFGELAITLIDEIENETFKEETLMLLYHINLGYPFLTDKMQLYIPTKKVIARDDDARGHEEEYNVMDLPKDNEPEYVFIHELKQNSKGNTWILAINKELQMGFKLEYNMKNLPYFMEWKSTASGDYVLGLEPSNSSVFGRKFHEENNSIHMLKSFEKETNILRFEILDGMEKIQSEIEKFEHTFHQKFKLKGEKNETIRD